MPSIAETLASPQSEMAATLEGGLELLSARQTVSFTRYQQVILPLDGFVFWLRDAGSVITAEGSLHVARRKVQDETETYSVNRVIFTTETSLGEDFNDVGPTTIYIGVINGQQFAFSNQDNFYEQAGLCHYAGDAVYPPLLSQIVNDLAKLNHADVIVSNSLPVWLALNIYVPPYPGFQMPSGLTLYPSFLVPPNIAPPYGVVDIAPAGTEAFGALPFLDSTLSSWQAGRERVRVTLYGCNNDIAVSFLNFVLQYSEDTSNIGVVGQIPIIRDEKLKQVELGIIAQKKTIDFDVSFQQSALRNVARQMIASVVNGYHPLPYTWQNA